MSKRGNRAGEDLGGIIQMDDPFRKDMTAAILKLYPDLTPDQVQAILEHLDLITTIIVSQHLRQCK